MYRGNRNKINIRKVFTQLEYGNVWFLILNQMKHALTKPGNEIGTINIKKWFEGKNYV